MNERDQRLFLVLAAIVAISLALCVEYEFGTHQGGLPKAGPVPLQLGLGLGPVIRGTVSTTYNLTVTSAAPIPLKDLSFSATNSSGLVITIRGVCVVSAYGPAIGLWNGTRGQGWSSETTSTNLTCTNGTAPRGQLSPGDSSLSTSDEIFFYVGTPLAPGSMLTILAEEGQFNGSVSRTYLG